MTVYDMLPETGPTHDLATVIAWSVQRGVIFVVQTFCKETNYMLTGSYCLLMLKESTVFTTKIKIVGLIKLHMVYAINPDNATNQY
jgi:hypothetical protein